MNLVGTNIQAENAGWSFENIADDFDEHVRRSVPLYEAGHDLVCKLSDFFMPESATVVELGTATGVLAGKFLEYNKRRSDISYIGIDCVESMLEKARGRCIGDERVLFKNDDIVTDRWTRAT